MHSAMLGRHWAAEPMWAAIRGEAGTKCASCPQPPRLAQHSPLAPRAHAPSYPFPPTWPKLVLWLKLKSELWRT